MYDTTYEHETMNEHPSQERVVLHVDFFNTFALTPVEIEVNERNPKHFSLVSLQLTVILIMLQVMQYIYGLREEFMKAEGKYS